MSIFHKTLSEANRLVDQWDKPIAATTVKYALTEHINECEREFKTEDMQRRNIILSYIRLLESARKLSYFNATPDERKLLKAKIDKAHTYVLKLETLTRKELGENHKFLE
jgi:hypothetical protein